MYKTLLIIGALSGFIGVSLGAFGAHALKQRLDQEMLQIFEVGVRYQMYHALAICLAAILGGAFSGYAGWAFVAGTVIFSGSLYILALTGTKAWGAVTPIGGVLFLLGWVLLAIAAWKHTGFVEN